MKTTPEKAASKTEAITTDEFDRILKEILSEMSGATLLTYRGVYEIMSEELNGDVIQRWEHEQKQQREWEQEQREQQQETE